MSLPKVDNSNSGSECLEIGVKRLALLVPKVLEKLIQQEKPEVENTKVLSREHLQLTLNKKALGGVSCTYKV